MLKQQKRCTYVANLNNVCNIDKNPQKLTFTNNHGGTAMDDSSSSVTNPPQRMSVEPRSDGAQTNPLARRPLLEVWWRVGKLLCHGEVAILLHSHGES